MKVSKEYFKKLSGGGLIVLGTYLLIEHILVWGQLDFWDFFGHEWVGFILLIIGILPFVNFKKPPNLLKNKIEKFKLYYNILKKK